MDEAYTINLQAADFRDQRTIGTIFTRAGKNGRRIKELGSLSETHDISIEGIRIVIVNKVEETSLVIDKQESSIIQIESGENLSDGRGDQSANGDKSDGNRETHD
jgi:hypothetical protein